MTSENTPKLGIIGGLSYHSSLIYYRLLNEKYALKFGADRSLPLLMYSHDFGIIGQAQQKGAWQEVREAILKSALTLTKAGCQSLIIASNTIHKYAQDIERTCKIPVLHIGDAIKESLLSQGCRRVGLLGTRPTMEEPFLKHRIMEAGSLELEVPVRNQRQEIHDLIWHKLVRGDLSNSDKQWFQDFCNSWSTASGLDAIVLSCTELVLLEAKPMGFTLIDSLETHVDFALKWHFRILEFLNKHFKLFISKPFKSRL